MYFLLGVLLVVAFVALLIGSPAFRRAALVVAAIVGLGIFWIIQDDNATRRRAEQERQVAAARVASEWGRISLDAVQVRSAQLGNGPSWRNLKLDVKNNSNLYLKGMRVGVQLYDCPRGTTVISPSCDKIGDAERTIEGDVPTSASTTDGAGL
jgi:hypothetical protein